MVEEIKRVEGGLELVEEIERVEGGLEVVEEIERVEVVIYSLARGH